MERDFRSSPEFAAVTDFYSALLQPGGHVFGARALCGHVDASDLWFIGQSFETGFEGGVSSRLFRVARAGGTPERLNDRETRQMSLSPDGQRLAVACAGDRPDEDSIALFADGKVTVSATIPGRIEQVDWSPDGTRLLLVVAGKGADLAGIHGGFAQKKPAEAAAWLPEVQTGDGDDLWRSIWTWTPGDIPASLTTPPLNVWEASWCGVDAIAAVTSTHHAEGSWYEARLSRIDATSGLASSLHVPSDQLGWVKGAPDGRRVGFVEALCSDRGLVAGRLSILDLATGEIQLVETNGIDVTGLAWRSPSVVHFAGARDAETVSADFDMERSQCREIWASKALTHGEWVPSSLPIGVSGALFVAEAFSKAPFLAEATEGRLHEVASLSAPGVDEAMRACGVMEPFAWPAPDGLEITGWLVRPLGVSGATPLLVDVHGGPISAHRNRWMARTRAAPLLVSQGWGVLFPNPRGSTGRGDAFVRAVKGDMGGADALDITSGVEALIARGWADPARIAVTGTSYGGFMSAWLPSQCRLFAAAIPISPVGDWYSQHRTTQIPEFDELMLESSPWDSGGAYFDRSPAFHRYVSPVPTLIMAGAIDKSTPAGQAQECHFAALRSGSPSTLILYPNAGHSLRSYPEYLDSAARILRWLATHVTT